MVQTLLNTLLASLITTLSMPGYLYGGLVFFSLIPLFFALEKKGPFISATVSFLYFFVFSFSNFHYLINTLTTSLPELFGRFNATTGFFVFILFCILEALPFLLFGFFYGLWAEKVRFRFLEPLFVASIYVIADYLRGIGDLGFTGGRLSDALYNFRGLLQILPYTGTLGLVFLIVVLNYEGYKLLRANKQNFVFVLAIVALIFLINGTVESFLPKKVGDKPVVLAQTNTPQKVKYTYDPNTIIDYLENSFSNAPALLTIFPEAVFSGTDIRNSEVERKLLEKFKNRVFVIGYPTLVGNNAFNSAVIYANGQFLDKYDKVHLFPFVENLPYKEIFGRLAFLRGMYYFSPGEIKTFNIEGYGKVGLQICFESFFPYISRKMSKEANILIVITNDGWYDSRIPLVQHFVQAIFRAVETRRNVVQVSNTGISGVVDEYGNFVTLPENKTTWGLLYVKPNDKVTFYATYGDYIVLVSLILTILVGITAKKKRTIFD
ncbi:apolipoprotein N-acyltransferase [Fervidobacterium changbaicum]|uniref:Apolipoprotein N-acyltransferase n=1 Tax=Fervidobacterium changbaicum TaxID=310769 RepID=A0ABX5QUF1_9BACT|nr:apolipoprotein N-acyltransferase [Fervidobacterium changbaicum]QAV33888.1 apolipoprotein N-acyltransferase [Fervidobacterium changbaicum]SDH73530.1 apolipoprotein N-acyltransferase [Fervidobacterium changbaicum]